ncbi:acyl-CoA thioesterase II [Polaribacter pacificus]|uniref:Acyl-CoA thioesterase 2 n=1 Tax=Polaribacter pacificus TaxID=1775173 RepID=A0A917MC01_9FLAO|nr:acyl-CoA thioesterase II [Polaribacter pacificus]GGG93471.1 acyl-CoA thioesterase II [Polaribacter pacificus]
MTGIDDLLSMLDVDKTNENEFTGLSITIGSPNVFGGQVLAQSINAAYKSIKNNRVLHSLHAYFLEPGHLEIPIVYKVTEMRNGGSFSTRRVTALQNDKTIFILAASFHKEEEGFEHQMDLKTAVKQPEELLSWEDMLEQMGDFLPGKLKAFLEIERPIDFKPTMIVNPLDKEDLPPLNQVWFRVKGDAKELDLSTKQEILTYISDYNILNATLYPNGSKANFGNMQMASLDHSMWFFRDFDLSDWLLYDMDSPNSFGARGFARGHIYTREGKLVASVAQEGLMRPIKKNR